MKEYIGLENSGNSDPLVQMEKFKNVISRSKKLVPKNQKPFDFDKFDRERDFLNNVSYVIVDERKSLPLRKKDERRERLPSVDKIY